MSSITPSGILPKTNLAAERIPSSTYRLQLNSEFTFRDALRITEYLDQLGISDCYASPIFTARPESTHGYDVCDWDEINPSIGTWEEFDEWAGTLRTRNMGLLLDIVPNHMGADPCNPWWRDVLRNGPSSKFARWFDIQWRRPQTNHAGKVLLPILEDHYWKVLEAGKIKILAEADEFVLAYHEHRLPLSTESLELLEQRLVGVAREKGGEALREMTVPVKPKPKARPAFESSLRILNGTAGEPRSFDALHAFLQQQHYQLAYWRVGNEALNYRRFFDVRELVAVRMELPEVFATTHHLLLQLVKQGTVTGLRVDHPDGLWNPKQYFARLQAAIQPVGAGSDEDRGPQGEPRSGKRRFYVIVEKILSGREALPSDWPVSGTTGYEFLNLLNGLFVAQGNRTPLDEVYREFTGTSYEFASLVFESKLEILRTSMLGDLRTLSALLESIAGQTRYGMDFGSTDLFNGLAAVIAAFPVYRTYLSETSPEPAPEDRARIQQAIQTAAGASAIRDTAVFSFIESLLLLCFPADLDESGREYCRQFVLKFQQLTGPVMAKGLEDTAFYRFNRFISLNEVGGAPDQFGSDLALFHEQNQWRAEHWPNSLLATATHDTKRGEDIRARLNVLSEMPEEWRQAVLKWRTLNEGKKTFSEGQPAPDTNDEYFLYQTLVGAWLNEAENGPDSSSFRSRISAYMLKAIREAKVHTSWTENNQPYEQAIQRFIEEILTPSAANAFLDDFMLFQRKVAFFGLFNSLAQTVLKMTVPGVPDFYQGTELWDYNLVDPDNRRLVDYQKRRALLSELEQKFTENESDATGLLKGLLKNYQSGQIKLYLVWRILELRRRRPELFAGGQYIPISGHGPKREHLCAFARTNSDESVIAVAVRLIVGLTQGAQRGALESDVWQDTTLSIPAEVPAGKYRNVLTRQIVSVPAEEGTLALPEVLGLLPVAVLERCG